MKSFYWFHLKTLCKIEVITLDSIFEEINAELNETKVYMKMDTQDYDLEVFAGTGNYIKDIIGLQSEVSVIPIYEDIPDYIESIPTFRKYGFEITGLYPVTRDGNSLAIIEFDCVMTRLPNKLNYS